MIPATPRLVLYRSHRPARSIVVCRRFGPDLRRDLHARSMRSTTTVSHGQSGTDAVVAGAGKIPAFGVPIAQQGGDMIEVQHLTKYFGPVMAVNDVSFQVEPNEIV